MTYFNNLIQQLKPKKPIPPIVKIILAIHFIFLIILFFYFQGYKKLQDKFNDKITFLLTPSDERTLFIFTVIFLITFFISTIFIIEPKIISYLFNIKISRKNLILFSILLLTTIVIVGYKILIRSL